jgi:hypothetical protein
MTTPKLKCQPPQYSEDYVTCTASSGETFTVVCPLDTVPLLRPTDTLVDHRFVCGTAYFQPKTTGEWMYDHRDVLFAFAAFLVGMLLAVAIQAFRRWKIMVVRR